jgi:hypothetical protein
MSQKGRHYSHLNDCVASSKKLLAEKMGEMAAWPMRSACH